MPPLTGKKLMFYVTEDWYFVSHRLALATAAKDAGYDVSVVTRVREYGKTIECCGLKLIPFENSRGGLNPVRELLTLFRLIRLWQRERPHIVHHVAIKPVLYGSIAARIAGIPVVVNAFGGMGWVFSSRSTAARLINRVMRLVFRYVLSVGTCLVQNSDDEKLLIQLGIPRSEIKRIAGAGVDLSKFAPTVEPNGIPTILFPARLLRDKGIEEFVAAARILRRRGVQARFAIAGTIDPANPSSISESQLNEWVREGLVEHVGWVVDMPRLLASSSVVCLPSYREGLPKALIEASAAGRPIVTTDVPGCREVVRDEETGLVVPVRDPVAIAAALEKLISSRSLRGEMGAKGRLLAEAEFGLATIIEQTMRIYREHDSTV